MHTIRKALVVLFLINFLSACLPVKEESVYKLIYKNDEEGNAIAGSKEALINAIRLGATVRIGWGTEGKTHRIEHLSDPVWIAVLDEKEVIVHLDPQVLSSVDWDNLSANYADSTSAAHEWRVAITTKGEFDAIWYDRKNHSISRRVPQNHIMSWYVKDVDLSRSAVPLFSKE
ncbi:MAG: hypothetical protein ABJG78_15790 [Cyclobacteriaceae bacterium]